MGWRNGVAYCQRNLEVGLAPVSDIASGCIDDILVGTPLQEKDAIKEMLLQHDKDLRRTLEGLKAADFVASGPKCTFFIKEVEFCGHCLKEGVTKPLPGRLLSLEKWELPKTITALCSFLGFCKYYAGYVCNFSTLATPILEKLKLGRFDGKKGSKLKLV